MSALAQREVANQCVAHKSAARGGARCRKSAIRGGNVCHLHGGGAPQVRAAANARMARTADKAQKIIDEMLDDPATPPNVRAHLAINAVDRVHGTPTRRVHTESETRHSLDPAVMASIERARQRQADRERLAIEGRVIDVEIVREDAPNAVYTLDDEMDEDDLGPGLIDDDPFTTDI